MTIKPVPALILAAIAIGGWFWYEHQQQERERRAERRAARISYEEAARQPTTTTWPTADGDFIQIEHRVPMMSGSGVMEVQRCYVWRDRVTNTSSMSCVNDGGLDIGD